MQSILLNGMTHADASNHVCVCVFCVLPQDLGRDIGQLLQKQEHNLVECVEHSRLLQGSKQAVFFLSPCAAGCAVCWPCRALL